MAPSLDVRKIGGGRWSEQVVGDQREADQPFFVDDFVEADFFAVLLELEPADDFFAEGLEVDPFEADAFPELAERFFAVLVDDVAFRPLAERDLLRAERTGRFQPTALSARNVCGIEMTLSGLSITAAAAASARSARTSEMTLAGRRARAACTLFVSSRTNICRSGSIQMDVPV